MKGKDFFKRQYRSIFSYLKSHWKVGGVVLLAMAEFLVFAVLNVEASGSYEQYVAETSVKYSGRFPFIFWENLESGLRLVLMGTVPLGLGTLFGAYATVAGLVSACKWLLPEIGGRTLLLCVLPHGMFEIPAICFSVLLSALWSRAVTAAIIRLLRREPAVRTLCEDGLSVLKSAAFVQIPLILIAAVIEVTVSLWVVSAVT